MGEMVGYAFALIIMGGGTGVHGDATAMPDPQGIVGGSAVPECGWPTTVSTGGCTATLVHPQAISTAQHCGAPSAIQFGENGNGPTVGVGACVGDGSADAMLCQLNEAVTELPVTPVLFGCELDTYLQVGAPVAMAGFGQTSFGQGGGTKLWAAQTIAAVEPGRVIVGDPGDGTSPCPGDSGGPVFIQVGDGSWRTIGTVLSGTTGIPCNSAADFQRLDPVVGNFEMQTGLDITPCFDGQTGAWDAGPECGGFFAGDHNGSGTWSDWCSGTAAGGLSDECGAAFGDGGDDGADDGATGDDGSDGDDSPTADGEGGSNSGDGTTGYVDPDDDDDGGGTAATSAAMDTDGVDALPPSGGTDTGGCSVGGRRAFPLTLVLLPLLGAGRRRRRRCR